MLQPDFDAYVTELCKGIKSRPRREEVMEELYGHLEDNYERNIAVGMTEEEARLDAMSKMGDRETLSYRLSAVNSYSPLKAMNSAFFELIAGYICLNSFIGDTVNRILFYFGVLFMFSALLRMRKMNRTMEKAFHCFNFFVIAKIAFYWAQTGNILHQYVFGTLWGITLLIQAIFWIMLFVGLDKFCAPYVQKEQKHPNFLLPLIYHLLTDAIVIFFIFLYEGEDFRGESIDSFVLPLIIIFVFFYTVVQFVRMRRILWDADGEYGILPRDKKNIAVFACVAVVIVGATLVFNFASSTTAPVKTELIIHDVSEKEQAEADKIRQKMLDWDVDPRIVEDLPDSEILNYKDAEFVTFGADGGSVGGATYDSGTSSDVHYYWFFIPENDDDDYYNVRLLCYIESHYSDKVKSFYRKGFYYMPWQNYSYGIDVFPLNLEDELNGSYIGIITEEKGKKYNAEPFFTYRIKDLVYEFPTDYPKGFDYKEEKGQRVYFAIQIGITHPEEVDATIYAATVKQRWFASFNYKSTADFIKNILKGDSVHIPADGDLPYYYRLHNIHTMGKP